MKFFSDFFKAVANCFKAFSVLFGKGLWPYMFIPLILWIGLWIASLYGMFMLAGSISDWLQSYFSLESIPEDGHWLSFARPFLLSKFKFILSLVLKFLFWMISGTFIKYILLILLSPVFAIVSEKTEELLSGKRFVFSFSQLTRDIFRGVIISVRNMFIEYFFIFLCFIVCFFFPPMIFVSTPFLLLMGWYFTGFALMDYNCERHRMSVSESIRFMKTNRGYACGTGLVYGFFMGLPLLPGQIAGIMFGPTTAVIGGTISFLEIKRS